MRLVIEEEEFSERQRSGYGMLPRLVYNKKKRTGGTFLWYLKDWRVSRY